MVRRRKGSTSSVESLSSKMTHWLPESSILKPAPKIEDQWPAFELKDAVVYGKDGNVLENALDVLLKGPLIVRGTIVIEDQADYFRNSKSVSSKLSAEIPVEMQTEIQASKRYSIGLADPENDDEEDEEEQESVARVAELTPVLWLDGHGGWFEIKPAPAYLPIYRNICRAIKLFYIIDGIIDEKVIKNQISKSKSSDPIERLAPLFNRYAGLAGDCSTTLEDVAESCNDYAPFLFCQLLDNDETHKKWKSSYFYTWLTENNQELFTKTCLTSRNPKSVALGPSTTSPLANALPSRVRKEPLALTIRPPQEVRLTSRLRSTRSKSAVTGAQELPASPAKSTSIEETQAKYSAVPRQRSTKSRSSTNPDTSPRPTAAACTSEQAIPTMSEAEKSAFETVLKAFETAFSQSEGGKTIVYQLYITYRFKTYKTGESGAHNIPIKEVLHYNAARLLQRLDQDPKKYHNTKIYTELQHMAKTKFVPVAMKLSDFPYHVMPRHRKTRAPTQPSAVSDPFEDEDDSKMSHNDFSFSSRIGKGFKNPGRRPAKSSLRLATGSKKRPHADVDSEAESDLGAKRLHHFSDGDDTMEGAGDSFIEDEDPIKLVIRAEKIPSTTPHGPHGAWVCEQEDCDHIVRGGDAEACQARIQQHFEDHEQQVERLQLAINEGSRGHLPINHLLDKIKKIGEAEQNREQNINGMELPRRIKRTMLV